MMKPLTAAERQDVMRALPDSRGARVLAYIDDLEGKLEDAWRLAAADRDNIEQLRRDLNDEAAMAGDLEKKLKAATH